MQLLRRALRAGAPYLIIRLCLLILGALKCGFPIVPQAVAPESPLPSNTGEVNLAGRRTETYEVSREILNTKGMKLKRVRANLY
jgi:hypothetical protein